MASLPHQNVANQALDALQAGLPQTVAGMQPSSWIPGEAPSWYAVSVYPRHEKSVNHYLRQRGLNSFLPLYRSVRRWADRRKELDLVLFPGYVFVNLDLRDQLIVLQSSGVVRFVSFQGRPAAVNDHEIHALAAGLTAGVRAEPHPFLREGKRVRVIRGPLFGAEGILKRRKDRFRLVLSIELIMRSVMLEVDEADVEPC
ncbi:MAG: transcription termination/antitermination protein NusG [Terriglobales bacterium]